MMHKKKPMSKPEVIKGIMPESKTSNDMVCELICMMLPAITRLKWFHLNSKDYNEHLILDEIYTSLGGLNDELAEQYIEHKGPLPDYEGHKYYSNYTHLIMDLKKKVMETECKMRGMNATIDVIHTVLVKGLYKLQMLTK